MKTKPKENWEKEFDEKFYKWEFFEVLKPQFKEELKFFICTLLQQEREELLGEIEKIETKKHWSSHLEFLYRHRKEAEIAKDLLYLSAMEEEIKNCENWFKNIFGEKTLETLKKKLK